jgi:DNA adenine methylase
MIEGCTNRIGARFNELISSGLVATKEAAGLFYYLNRTGYNGLWSVNKSGQFNVPFGRYKTINYTTDFSAYKAAFAEWEFTCETSRTFQFSRMTSSMRIRHNDVEFTHTPRTFLVGGPGRLAEWLAKHSGL